MNFQDMQNLTTYRARQYGVNFGNPINNQTSGLNPPYSLKMLLNLGYAEFLSRTMDYPIAALAVTFPSQANVSSYSLNPVPNQAGGAANPAALRVYEMTYTPAGAQERYIRIVGTPRFRAYAGGYVRRFGNYAQWPQVVSQMFGRRQLDMVPGTAVANDTIKLTICPDIIATGTTCTAANGGQLSADADVPLIPSQFHMAPVEYALSQILDMAKGASQRENCEKRFEGYVEKAIEFASSYGEGDMEQVVVDPWQTPLTDADFT